MAFPLDYWVGQHSAIHSKKKSAFDGGLRAFKIFKFNIKIPIGMTDYSVLPPVFCRGRGRTRYPPSTFCWAAVMTRTVTKRKESVLLEKSCREVPFDTAWTVPGLPGRNSARRGGFWRHPAKERT